MTATERAINAAADALRQAVADQTPERMRAVADALVELRSQCVTADGDVDWLGKGRQYRRAVAEVYLLAGVHPTDRNRVASAVRYHLGSALRAQLTASECYALGLHLDTPRTRQARRRRSRSAARADVAQVLAEVDQWDRERDELVALEDAGEPIGDKLYESDDRAVELLRELAAVVRAGR